MQIGKPVKENIKIPILETKAGFKRLQLPGKIG